MDATIKLAYNNAAPYDLRLVAPQVWEELYYLTSGVLKAYYSDLYHDAIALREALKSITLFEFYYSFNDSGTSLGLTEKAHTRQHKYRMTVSVEKGNYTMRIQGA